MPQNVTLLPCAPLCKQNHENKFLILLEIQSQVMSTGKQSASQYLVHQEIRTERAIGS